MLLLGGSAGDDNEDVLVAFLVDLGPLLVDPQLLPLLNLSQLRVADLQFRIYFHQLVQFYAHLHLLVRPGDALPGNNGEESVVGDLQPVGGFGAGVV